MLSGRSQLWREVAARNLDRFSAWIALQQTMLDALWERFERVVVLSERDGEGLQGGLELENTSVRVHGRAAQQAVRKRA